MITKTELPGIYKDDLSGALINKDNAGLLAYKKRKEQTRRIEMLEKRITDLESALSKLMTDWRTK